MRAVCVFGNDSLRDSLAQVNLPSMYYINFPKAFRKQKRKLQIPDTVAEWLRRWIANPLLFERVSSNLTTVVLTL